MPSTTTLALMGLVLSCYALYVEYKMEHKDELGGGDDFKALCDIEQIGASCSQVFMLPEGRLLSFFGLIPHGHVLDLPNAALGAIYYIVRLLPGLPSGFVQVAASVAMLTSVFLAYKLTVLMELCILCWTTHVLNAMLLYNAFSKKSSKTKLH